jgi:predicted nuclease of predicted toxin-antitoxin system
MKFLADHCVSKRTTDFLIGEHYDVATLKELGLQDLKDAEIIKLAIARDDVLITEDKGFGNILDYPPHTHQGVIVLNVRTRSRKGLHGVLAQFLSSVNRDQLRQALIQVDERLARVRR